MSDRTAISDETSAKDEAQACIDAIVEHDRDATSRPQLAYQPRRGKKPLLTALTLVLVIVTGVNIVLMRMRHAEPFSPEEAQADAFMSLMVAIDAINEYREWHGMLPPTLELIGADAEGLTYTRDGSDFGLQIEAGGRRIVFADGDDPDQLSEDLNGLLEGQS